MLCTVYCVMCIVYCKSCAVWWAQYTVYCENVLCGIVLSQAIDCGFDIGVPFCSEEFNRGVLLSRDPVSLATDIGCETLLTLPAEKNMICPHCENIFCRLVDVDPGIANVCCSLDIWSLFHGARCVREDEIGKAWHTAPKDSLRRATVILLAVNVWCPCSETRKLTARYDNTLSAQRSQTITSAVLRGGSMQHWSM